MKKVIFYLLVLISYATGFSQTVKTDLTYLVNAPASRNTKTPVLIMLHGYGSNESDLFDISKSIDNRFITFSLRAPVSLGEGAYCWYNITRVEGKPFIYDYKEAKVAETKILSFISNACKAYNVDSTQVYLMGFSQGAIMSYELSIAAPKKIKGILALSGRMMTETQSLTTNWDQVANVKYFIAHGNSDNMIKQEESDKAAEFLKTKKVTDVTYHKYEMPHSICGAELNDIKAWLTKAINPEKKPAMKK